MRKSFYSSQSIYSEPGPYRETFMRGGVEPKSISQWINSFMQHPRGPESEKRGFKSEQAADLELRSVADILSVAVKRNLIEGDSAQHKVGGVCRDFAILAVSIFRERGTPARLRVGFADYLVQGYWEDHWLCEWYDVGRWKRLDVEFAAIEGVPFDTLDVPHERFLTASEAWFRTKEDPEIASRFGVSSLELGGEWFVAGSLFREIAALRRLELKPWDYWGLSEDLSRVSTDWSQQTRTTLDQLALLLKNSDVDGDGEPKALADLPLPTRVVSFPRGEAVVVLLRNFSNLR
ncbi:transglutaminase-like domain-containing protein [Agrobacterium vitis]|uniref:transglutaminase-like domain-containing protein n=1 Tax=Agrobacterium vitis TaxID=373 RepID=UPI0015737FD7|nr:transglutaminase-like domain-containing protein [Agrobacterium vitis]NSZ16648.1 transglutaminase domain-containing protein [Agrobacterium vitis]QZO05408.1 transglutaminase-like domain-containing protein [Agrobacterium vitis]UJL87554.1 transglutaminase domain-containing protein [Agrobacterium vitis]